MGEIRVEVRISFGITSGTKLKRKSILATLKILSNLVLRHFFYKTTDDRIVPKCNDRYIFARFDHCVKNLTKN